MKKRLLSVILAICLLTTLPCATAFADGGAVSFSASTEVDGVTIQSASANGETFLLLPPTADLTKLTLDFGDVNVVTLSGELGKVAANKTFDLATVATLDKEDRYVLSAETKTGKRYRLYILQGETIPTL
ncbi:MAG: hypothetical protein IJO79_06425, partial [Firmicutes bacterium]|nr:hypothetical protein [Bacillota bacterium]